MSPEEWFATKPAAGWSPEVRAAYVAFAARLMRDEPLAVKVGAGGLSFYKPTLTGPVFVCHYNATPRGGSTATGFADFRRDALEHRLDLPTAIERLQSSLGPTITLRAGRIWHSLHFPAERAADIADALRDEIIAHVS